MTQYMLDATNDDGKVLVTGLGGPDPPRVEQGEGWCARLKSGFFGADGPRFKTCLHYLLVT